MVAQLLRCCPTGQKVVSPNPRTAAARPLNKALNPQMYEIVALDKIVLFC